MGKYDNMTREWLVNEVITLEDNLARAKKQLAFELEFRRAKAFLNSNGYEVVGKDEFAEKLKGSDFEGMPAAYRNDNVFVVNTSAPLPISWRDANMIDFARWCKTAENFHADPAQLIEKYKVLTNAGH
jgi:hypothetical protein